MSDEMSMQERLFYALHRNDAGEVGYVLRRHPVLARAPAVGGFAPIHAAATSEDTRCLDVLITYGADVNQMDRACRTPLAVAASLENYAAIDLLLTRGADPNQCDEQGVNHLPLQVRDMKVIDYLVERGLRLDGKASKSSPAIFHFKDGRPAAALHLVDALGCDVNAPDLDGWTLAHWAALRGDAPFMKELIGRGARMDSVAAQGDSPLEKAVLSPDTFRLILDHDKAPGLEQRMSAALTSAAFLGGLEAAKMLVEKGCLPDAGQVAQARERGHRDVAVFLEDIRQADIARRQIERLNRFSSPRRGPKPGGP